MSKTIMIIDDDIDLVEAMRITLESAGFDVIEWHYTETKEDLVQRRKDIFRKIC